MILELDQYMSLTGCGTQTTESNTPDTSAENNVSSKSDSSNADVQANPEEDKKIIQFRMHSR